MHRSFSNSIFDKIKLLDREGNINGVIAEGALHYNHLGPVKLELLEKIAFYLKKYPTIISRQSTTSLKNLPNPDLKYAGIPAALNDLPSDALFPKPGRICFPVVTVSIGMMREIRFTNGTAAGLAPNRLAILDQVGSPVFEVLRRKLNRMFLWRPDQYHHDILNTFEREDPHVDGESLGLPLALALYSHVTQIPVPPDLSATGRVMRDGTIRPISGVNKKLQALKQERWFIKRVLLPAQQEIDETVPGIDLIRVQTIDEAIAVAFPSRAVSVSISAEIDLEGEVAKTEKQYDAYLIDTCLKNASELIRHMESEKQHIPVDRAVPALFTCYWRRGSCYCHKGDVKRTEENLKKADRLYKNSPGLIRETDYWNSRVNYAVLLKDIFRYNEAEKRHIQIQEKIEQIGGLDHEKGKNLSSLSQLYLARGRFSRAEALQKRAIRLIRETERARNYGYLAQVYMRAGHFKRAKYNLERADELLRGSGTNTAGNPFHDWISSEYLYRYGKTLKAPGKRHWEKLEQLISGYSEIMWYVPGLIHKFAGLAMLDLGDEAGGLQKLDEVIRFFDAKLDPVLRLLGAAVRVERSLYFLQRGQPEKIADDLRKIREDLGMQKDIKRFFQNELTQISRYLRFKAPMEKEALQTVQVLSSLQKQIPY